MASIISPNMNLIIPTVGTEPGPQYAQDVNNSLTTIDSHNHSLGEGVQINSDGININAMLSFNNNPLTSLSYLSLISQPSLPSVNQSIATTPISGISELFYTDSNGTATQITKNGVVNSAAASIPGESYNSISGTFIWKQGAGSSTPAGFDIGQVTIRPNIASTASGVTLTAPTGTYPEYTLQLLTIPTSLGIVTISSTGILSSQSTITGSQISANTITGSNIVTGTITGTQISTAGTIAGDQIANATITGTNIANNTVTGNNIASATVTYANMTGVNFTTTGSSGNFTTTSTSQSPVTNLTTPNITTSGHPVMIMLQPDGTTNIAQMGASNSTNQANALFIGIYRNNTLISVSEMRSSTTGSGVSGNNTTTYPGAVSFIDNIGAGTYSYQIRASVDNAGTTGSVSNCVVAAYEIR